MTALHILGIIVVSGTFVVVDGACHAACVQNCEAKLDECLTPFWAARQTAQTAQQGYFTGSPGTLATTENFKLGVQAACDDPENNVFDVCGELTTLDSCINNNVPSDCDDGAGIGDTLASIRDSVTQACETQADCFSYALLKCQCKVLSNVNDLFGSLCSGYSELGPCLDALPAKCTGNADVTTSLNYMKEVYAAFYHLRCINDVCSAAVPCVEPLADSVDPLFQGRTGNDGSDGFLYVHGGPDLLPQVKIPNIDLSKMCPKLGSAGHLTVFDCLKTAVGSCDAGQGDVTMADLKVAYTELCTQVLPQIVSPVASPGVDNCPALDTCVVSLDSYPDFTPLINLQPETIPPPNAVGDALYFLGNTTTTHLWCSWLQKHYECSITNAQACGLSGSAVDMLTKRKTALKDNCEV